MTIGMAMLKKMSRFNSLRLLLFVILLPLVSSCGNVDSYNKSADVNCEKWTSADALLFEVQVVDSLMNGKSQVLVKDEKYNLAISFRYSQRFPYTTIPIHLAFDNKKYTITPFLERKNTWSDLIHETFNVPNIPISFTDTGLHVITIFPDTILSDIYSLGIEIRK